MGTEIERKFLLQNEAWRGEVIRSVRFVQGYLGGNDNCSIRVRITDEQANINIKGARLGIERQEFEYRIPEQDAELILRDLANKPYIDKTRHYVERASHVWEIDEFEGDNAGLIVAEIELTHPDEAFDQPAWLGPEVSDEPRYYNVNLVKTPYSKW